MATVEASVLIEPGTSGDLDGVMQVMEAAFGDAFGEAWTRSQCAGILPMSGVSLTLARNAETGELSGFSLVRSIADESELLLIAVMPDRHRRGIGTSLLDHFIEHARARGIGRVHLEVRDGNPAIEMYRSAGFVQAGRRRNYYRAPNGNRFDALTLVREL